MKTQPNRAILPSTLRSRVEIAVRARACDKRGRILDTDTRLTGSAVRSRLVLDVWSHDESLVHRVCALLLMQVGGRASFCRSRHDAVGRYLVEPVVVGTVVFPPSVEVVI